MKITTFKVYRVTHVFLANAKLLLYYYDTTPIQCNSNQYFPLFKKKYFFYRSISLALFF